MASAAPREMMNAKVDGLSVYLLDPTRNKDVAQSKELLLIDPQVIQSPTCTAMPFYFIFACSKKGPKE